MSDAVNHPPHYGGEADPYEAIKVIEAWQLGFHLGNVVKYLARAGRKDPARILEDLKKARWYLDRYIGMVERSESGTDKGSAPDQVQKLPNSLGDGLAVGEPDGSAECPGADQKEIEDNHEGKARSFHTNSYVNVEMAGKWP